MKETIQSLKGTRDYYPDDMAIRTWMYRTIRNVSELFGYQEYDGPFLEPIELYAAKSGEELVKEQSFIFPDRGGDLITLRPELTPSLARMIAQRQKQLVYPLRWWSFGPFWRYERPQKGRSREFFQWNIDLIGVSTAAGDAELVSLAANFFMKVGFEPNLLKILVNNRRLMDSEFDTIGISIESRPTVLRLVDRQKKMPSSDWEAYALETGLSRYQLDGLKGILSNVELWKKSDEMKKFFEIIESSGVGNWVQYSPSIIRGLDYYTGTVFEAWDNEGEFRSILGGGRYDNLVGDVGGEKLPGVGFAMGDQVITLLLKKFNLIPNNIGNALAKVLITVFDEESMLASNKLSSKLREAGIPTACSPEVTKLSKQFKYGDRLGMLIGVVIGPEEIEKGMVTIKILQTGEQESLKQEEVINRIKKIIFR